MRLGAEYRESLRDGRRVWVLGEGWVEDVTTHPATRNMVEAYVGWYERHFDPAWQDVALTPPDAKGVRREVGFIIPRTADDLVRMGRFFSKSLFACAGNITHTPAYGAMIALGIQHAVTQRNASAEQVANAVAYRDMVAETGRFITFAAGAAPIGHRLRPDPTDRTALRIVRETGEGLVISGRIGMHTSPCFVQDVYIGAVNGVDYQGHRANFVVPANGKGVTIICRRRSSRPDDAFAAPLSSRFDELDGQMWLDEVLVPWNRVFLTDQSPEPIARWLFWHQLYCWLAKAEFTLGLALACAEAQGLLAHEGSLEMIQDLVGHVQTVRSCQTAAERDPEFTPEGFACPDHGHVAAGSLAMLRARPVMGDILRTVPGSSPIVTPSDSDLREPELAAGFEAAFGGGGYTARQRAALLQLTWDHIGSALDHRESVYELHANGGAAFWRQRLRKRFDRYDELANGVLSILDLPMPRVDVSSIRDAPLAARRPVTPTKS